jgi:hypothetical protein
VADAGGAAALRSGRRGRRTGGLGGRWLEEVPRQTEERPPSGADGAAEGAAASVDGSRRRRLGGWREPSPDGA